MSDDLNDNPIVRQLREQIAALAARVQLAEAKLSEHDGPLRRIFFARRGGTDSHGNTLSWKEQTVVNGAVVEFTDGRECAADDTDAAMIDPAGLEAVMEIEDDGTFRYVPISPSVALVSITGNETGGGKYTGILISRGGANGNDDLSGAELGTTTGVIVRALNVREVGKSTHDIDPSGSYVPTVFLAAYASTGEDGVPVYVFDGRQSEDCT